MELLKISVTARESAGQPYTLVEIADEADVTNTDELRRTATASPTCRATWPP